MSQVELVVVGAIAGAFGVRGEVRVKSFTAEPAALFAYGPLLDEAGRAVLTVKSWRRIADGFAVTAKEAKSREAAEAMKSTRLYVARAALPAPADEEYYHADLVGLTVKGLAGEDLGVVKAIHDFGATALLEIYRTPGAKGSWMLPFTREAAPHVDLAKGEVVADPPVGLAPGRAAVESAAAPLPPSDGLRPPPPPQGGRKG